jgi:hypothetical protein
MRGDAKNMPSWPVRSHDVVARPKPAFGGLFPCLLKSLPALVREWKAI